MQRGTNQGHGLSTGPCKRYQHQYRFIAAGTPLTAYTYKSPRGEMKVFDGKVFVTRLTHQGVLPFVPDISGANALTGDATNSYHAALWRTYFSPFLASVSRETVFDGRLSLDRLIGGSDVYNQGQSMMAAAQLVPLLLQISKSSELSAIEQATARQAAEDILHRVKDVMGAWLSAKDDQVFQLLYYQPKTPLESGLSDKTGWQALLGLLGAFGSNESINDQHLGYGYSSRRLPSCHRDRTTDANKLGDMVNRIAECLRLQSRSEQSVSVLATSTSTPATPGPAAPPTISSATIRNRRPSGQPASGLSVRASDGPYRAPGVYLYNTEAHRSICTGSIRSTPTPSRPCSTIQQGGQQLTADRWSRRSSTPASSTPPSSPRRRRPSSASSAAGQCHRYLLGTQAAADRKAFIGPTSAGAAMLNHHRVVQGSPARSVPAGPSSICVKCWRISASNPQTALTAYLDHRRTMARVNPANNIVDGYCLH
jgi:hypothetical protein